MIYSLAIILFALGLAITLTSKHLLRKLLALGLLQSGIFLLYIGLGKRSPGAIPVLESRLTAPDAYSSPLPQVLILTAIVVGVATLAVGLGLITRHYRLGGNLNASLSMETEE